MRKAQQRTAAGHSPIFRSRSVLAAMAVMAAVNATARGDVVFGDFESPTAPGWGALTGAGVQPWAAPVSGAVIPGQGGLAASNVLQLTGQPTFNFGQSDGGALGFDFLSQNLRDAFFEHDQIEFDWYAPPNGSPSGYNQLYNIILNSQGGGFTNVAGHSQTTPGTNQYYFTGFNGATQHVVIDYTNYKNTVLASANPNGGGWLQFGMQPNAGDGAPAEQHFDNFKFSIAQTLWNVDADGPWSTDANWSPATHPNTAGRLVNFGPVITAARTVDLDASKTVGRIIFNNANKYTIAGAGTLTLDSTAAATSITVSNGSHEISAPLAPAKNLNVAVTAAQNTLTLSNLQASPIVVTKSGAGVLAVNHVRANELAVNEGTVAVLPDTTSAGVSNVGTLNIGASARLDLKRNKLVTATTVGSFNGTNYTGVQGDVQRAYNFGAWDQPGLTTSEDHAGQNAGILSGTTTIAVATAEQVMFIGPSDTAVFQGQTVTGATTIAMYTYAGDLNLDGVVDGADYGVIDNSVQFPGTDGYVNGDFNYDGVIDGADYGIIDNTIQLQGAPFPGVVFGASASASGGLSGVTAVPEPSACGVAILGAAALLARRARRSRDAVASASR